MPKKFLITIQEVSGEKPEQVYLQVFEEPFDERDAVSYLNRNIRIRKRGHTDPIPMPPEEAPKVKKERQPRKKKADPPTGDLPDMDKGAKGIYGKKEE